jgi:hypothetical protein
VTAYDGGDWNTDPGLVERVAAAMFGHGWGFTDEGGRAYWSDLARAAIGAMPTVPAQPPTPPTRTDTPNNPPEHHTDTLGRLIALAESEELLGDESYFEHIDCTLEFLRAAQTEAGGFGV